MKRRDAIIRLAYAAGFVVATPTVLSILASCSTTTGEWKPQFLSLQQGKFLTKLVNVFLPKTEQLPSATELNVPEFIDRYVDEIYGIEDQEKFRIAFENMTETLEKHSGFRIEEVEDVHLKSFLDDHLKIKGEVDKERMENPEFKGITTSELLNTIKSLSIKAYLTTEKIGEEVLAYEPIPGAYYCGDLQKLTGGKSWSIN